MERLKAKLQGIQNEMDIKRNLAYIILTNPQIYLSKLLKRTLIVGAVAFTLSFIYSHTFAHKWQIPSSTHSLIGIVIGLLLVFRTNTAYDRWWEGRKSISAISNAMCFYIIKLNSIKNALDEGMETRFQLSEFKAKSIKNLIVFLNDLKFYLKSTDDHKIDSYPFHKKQMDTVKIIMTEMKKLVKSKSITESDASSLESYLFTLMEQSNSCERIKNTPIPLGFLLHIKTSIYIYLLSLPFGLFYDLGLISTFMIMIIYYVIGGIEIISNEIENPFAGDPNDLPVDDLIENIKKSITKTEDHGTLQKTG